MDANFSEKELILNHLLSSECRISKGDIFGLSLTKQFLYIYRVPQEMLKMDYTPIHPKEGH